MKYFHTDVFSNKKFSGNGLTVFFPDEMISKSLMQAITKEMRQFESIFIYQEAPTVFRAYIFTMQEELDFAGHPVIGAAAVIHHLFAATKEQNDWAIRLNNKTVSVKTIKHESFYAAQMNQGQATFGNVFTQEEENEFLGYLNLSANDKYNNLPLQVVSTGLPYLIIPLKKGVLAKVKVAIDNLEEKLSAIGAKFFYVLDVENKEGRTWDNSGLVEDVATGSAAGPAGAYLVNNNFEQKGKAFLLQQGTFLQRPSKLKILISENDETLGDIFVEGDVCMIATGELLL